MNKTSLSCSQLGKSTGSERQPILLDIAQRWRASKRRIIVTTSPLVVSASPSIAKPFAFTATALVVAGIAVMFIVGFVSMQHLNGHIATVSSALEAAPQADQMKTSLEELQSGAREMRSALVITALGLRVHRLLSHRAAAAATH
jgi:hypothetical protein